MKKTLISTMLTTSLTLSATFGYGHDQQKIGSNPISRTPQSQLIGSNPISRTPQTHLIGSDPLSRTPTQFNSVLLNQPSSNLQQHDHKHLPVVNNHIPNSSPGTQLLANNGKNNLPAGAVNNSLKLGVQKFNNSKAVANYHLTVGKSFSHGYYYPGKNHCHWTNYCWWPSFNCFVNWDPCTLCYYYWCPADNCFYPISYAQIVVPTPCDEVIGFVEVIVVP